MKELGPGEIKPSLDSSAAVAVSTGGGVTSAQKSDLTLLRNANVPASLTCCLVFVVSMSVLRLDSSGCVVGSGYNVHQ